MRPFPRVRVDENQTREKVTAATPSRRPSLNYRTMFRKNDTCTSPLGRYADPVVQHRAALCSQNEPCKPQH